MGITEFKKMFGDEVVEPPCIDFFGTRGMTNHLYITNNGDENVFRSI